MSRNLEFPNWTKKKKGGPHKGALCQQNKGAVKIGDQLCVVGLLTGHCHLNDTFSNWD
jgi:hypothetical protein